MRSLIAAFLMLAIAAEVSAQQVTDKQRAEQIRSATRKIRIGLVLMGVGAVAAPVAALSRKTGDPGGGPAMNASIGVMFLGSGVVWWGAVERRRAVQPQIAIGIGLGRAKSIRLTRSW